MADNLDDQDMSFTEGEASEAAAPKPKGARGGLLKILMFVGIGIGAIILIITVVFLTVNYLAKQGKTMTQTPVSEEYQQSTPIYQYVTTIGEIRTRTIDKEPASVVVKINLGFSVDDKESPIEVTARLYQIRDYLRSYFSQKRVEELQPATERNVKEELRENLNQILSKPSIKEVLFEKLDVILM